MPAPCSPLARLLFAGLALKRSEYVDLWTRLEPDPTAEEAIRNFPISGLRFTRPFINALGLIKLSAAHVNMELGLLDRRIGEARRTAWVLGSIGQVAFQSGDYARADSVCPVSSSRCSMPKPILAMSISPTIPIVLLMVKRASSVAAPVALP